MPTGLEEVAALPDPVGEVIESSVRPNGLEVLKIRVPLGVVFFIYESRPNVTADAAAICVKSGNAVILRGGKEAAHSQPGDCRDPARRRRPSTACRRMRCTWSRRPTARRWGISWRCREYIDVAIPRGGESLIRRVAAEAKMPVIKHFTGNCHVYVDRGGRPGDGRADHGQRQVPAAGRLQRRESLLVHRDVAGDVSAADRRGAGRARHRDPRRRAHAARLVPAAKPATEEDYAAEFLGPIISVKVVDSLDEAIAHINRYGSQHTDAIVTGDLAAARAVRGPRR